MLIVIFENLNQKELCDKYNDKINYLSASTFKDNANWIITYIEAIKKSMLEYDLTIISYSQDVIACLSALNIEFKFVISKDNIINNITQSNYPIDILNELTLEQYLADKFDWIIKEEVQTNDESETNNEDVNNDKLKELAIPANKNKLTFEQLLSEDLEITEADVRDLKATQNKLKVGMLLQAKSSLNRVLKLSNILDKLYDKLLERIDNSLDSTDTASLMYTTEYISKALSDTNQFIVSLISNEKIQNFFIIDNSSVINVTDDRVDIDSREKIRKAVEIVLDNIDYFQDGQFDKMKNPNIIEVVNEEENSNGDTNA